MLTGLVDDPLFERHRTGPGHPERPARLGAVRKALEGLPLRRIEPRDATREEILRAHDPGYVDWLSAAIAQGAGSLDADTVVSAESWDAAVRAAAL